MCIECVMCHHVWLWVFCISMGLLACFLKWGRCSTAVGSSGQSGYGFLGSSSLGERWELAGAGLCSGQLQSSGGSFNMGTFFIGQDIRRNRVHEEIAEPLPILNQVWSMSRSETVRGEACTLWSCT